MKRSHRRISIFLERLKCRGIPEAERRRISSALTALDAVDHEGLSGAWGEVGENGRLLGRMLDLIMEIRGW